MKQYKNIVFDMGNVLLDYSPHTIVSQFTQDESIINRLVKEIFYQQEWLDLDQGLINDDEAYAQVIKRLDPSYHTITKSIFDHWHEYLFERIEMFELLNNLKQRGYKLYLFSNASPRFYQYEQKINCLSLFDQKIISADIKYSKPSHDFYQKAFEICGINANESFFIDDSVQNILMANQLNMDGYIHNGTYQLLYNYLRKCEIL